MDDGSVLAGSVLHAIAILVTNALYAERPAACDAKVEDKIEAVRGFGEDGERGVRGMGQDGRASMEAWDDGENGLVCDGDFQSGDVYLLGTHEELLHFVGEHGLVIMGERRGIRLRVEDGVMERPDGEPGWVLAVLAKGLGKDQQEPGGGKKGGTNTEARDEDPACIGVDAVACVDGRRDGDDGHVEERTPRLGMAKMRRRWTPERRQRRGGRRDR